ncbi:MAG: T9SS type A sorting domain-containing protein [Haliscomenobacter sp.]|nr:T9SS type A sorting domain-containing protein [Haliscomenobacter sp.]
MNVSLRNYLLITAVILAGHAGLSAQTVYKDTLELFRDSRGEYYFEAAHSPNGITKQALHGKVWVASVLPGSGNNKIYKLIYEPNAGFVGLDTFRYNRLTCYSPTCYQEWEVLVRVKSSEVTAESDLFYLPANSTEVALDVLQNDFGSSGQLRLVNIGTVNNGEARVQAGSPTVMFTPRTGFAGVAQLIYTVCDAFGTCDQGSVSVVVGQVQGWGEDTLRVFTLKDAPVDVLLPEVYTLLSDPEHGVLNKDETVPSYMPDAGFTGSEFLSFISPGNEELVVEIVVLDVVRNTFAQDDQSSVTPGKITEISVLNNDAYGDQAGCVTFSSAMYGKVTESGNGVFTYEAPKGFVGVDEFTYPSYPPGCTGQPETATVRVFVSNFEPAYSKFRMNTPMNTPLPITYNIPINDYRFILSQKARHGELLFLEGMVDTVIMGTKVFGYNILMYVPFQGATGTDEFEVTYCLTGSDSKGCRLQKSVKIEMDILEIGNGEPMCFDDCIWAGDTNEDGIVNMQDILPLGRYMGAIGRPRDEANLEVWYGQYGEDWAKLYPELQEELKHIDADGDSMITAQDTLAISRFYGRTHSLVPSQLAYSDYEIRLEGDVFVEPGQEVVLDLYIGDENTPVTDLYGFTFALNFNPLFFEPESPQIEFYDNSWLTYNAPVLSMSRKDGNGTIEAGFTRTNGLPAVGHGKIGRSKVVVTVDIIGVTPPDANGDIQIPIDGGFAMATNAAGQQFAVRVAPFTLTVRTSLQEQPKGDNQRAAGSQVLVFPNPASEWVQVYQSGAESLSRVQLFSATGQQMFDSGAIEGRQYAIPVRDLGPGMYFTRVTSGERVTTRKVQVQN